MKNKCIRFKVTSLLFGICFLPYIAAVAQGEEQDPSAPRFLDIRKKASQKYIESLSKLKQEYKLAEGEVVGKFGKTVEVLKLGGISDKMEENGIEIECIGKYATDVTEVKVSKVEAKKLVELVSTELMSKRRGEVAWFFAPKYHVTIFDKNERIVFSTAICLKSQSFSVLFPTGESRELVNTKEILAFLAKIEKKGQP